jgi:hypothetical protein
MGMFKLHEAGKEISSADRQEWADWLPPKPLFLPLKDADGKHLGTLLLARDEDWDEGTTAILQRLTDIYAFAWAAKHRPTPLSQWRHRLTSLPRWKRMVAAGICLVLIFPVRLSVLAQAEIVPSDPAVIRAPLDGVIETVRVQPTLDPLLRDRAGVVQEDLRKDKAELAALVAEANRLAILAPMDGRVLDILPGMKPGDWFSPRQKLGIVLGNSAPIAVAYLAEEELARIQEGAVATFSPHALESASRHGRVQRIDPSPAKTLPDGALASVHGGDIPARVSGQNIIPDGAITRVTITLEGPPPAHEEIGIIAIRAESSSFIGRLARSIMVVLIREWGA